MFSPNVLGPKGIANVVNNKLSYLIKLIQVTRGDQRKKLFLELIYFSGLKIQQGVAAPLTVEEARTVLLTEASEFRPPGGLVAQTAGLINRLA